MDVLVGYLKIISDPIISGFTINLKDLTDYNITILKLIYDKKFVKKHIYPEYIKQLLSSIYEEYSNYYNGFQIYDRSYIVEYLATLPQFEQRTPEWFEARKNSIGASESAIIFGKSIFSNRKKLIIKKCGHREPFKMNVACQHGTKYEPIIQKMYEMKNECNLLEFGSLMHPKYSMISASPDGITDKGVMIEIKAPYKRKIYGLPPVYYWYQMQQQLEVCNLDKVDFIECDIQEYRTRNEFKKDNEYKSNSTDNLKNIIIEYHDLLKNEVNWIYPETFLEENKIDTWVVDQKKGLNQDATKQFSRTTYYKVQTYSACEIWRDKEWWNNNICQYIKFWEEVKKHRVIGYESLMSKKRPRKKKEIVCDILSSDDEDN